MSGGMQGLGVGTLVAELRTDDTPRVNFHVRALAALQRAFIYCTATARPVLSTTFPTTAQCLEPTTRPLPQARTKSSIHDRTTRVHVRSLRDTENCRVYPKNEPLQELSQPSDERS